MQRKISIPVSGGQTPSSGLGYCHPEQARDLGIIKRPDVMCPVLGLIPGSPGNLLVLSVGGQKINYLKDPHSIDHKQCYIPPDLPKPGCPPKSPAFPPQRPGNQQTKIHRVHTSKKIV